MWQFFEVIGTVAFAISGALLGINKKLDIFGVIMLAVTTAVGGGIMRDTLIGNFPPSVLRDGAFAVISILAAFGVGLVRKSIHRFNEIILVFDAIGLGAFTATGANIAIQAGLNSLFSVIVLGTVAGIGGGILRDVFAQEIPVVFRKDIYAVAAVLGAASIFYGQKYFDMSVCLYMCFTITVGIRLLCIKFNVNLPVLGD